MPKVSICCLTYNHEKYCEEAIRSIWNQDYKNIEIIVLEDGSTDKTYTILSDLSEISPFPMTVITQKNIFNIAKSMNKMIKMTTGELLFLTSLDDKLHDDNVITKLVNEISKDKNIQFITTKMQVVIDDKSNIIAEREYAKDKLNINVEEQSLEDLLNLEKENGTFFIAGLLHKDLIDKIGGYEEDMVGDDIVLRIKMLKYMLQNPEIKLKFVDFPTIKYRVHATNIHKMCERQAQITYEILERYFNGANSNTLDNAIKRTILNYLEKRDFINALRVMFFDKKNKNKIVNFISLIKLKSTHLILKYTTKKQRDFVKKILNKIKLI